MASLKNNVRMQRCASSTQKLSMKDAPRMKAYELMSRSSSLRNSTSIRHLQAEPNLQSRNVVDSDDSEHTNDLEDVREIGSLFDFIEGDVLHVGNAARYVLYLKSHKLFNQASFDEFVRSDTACNVSRYGFDDIDKFSDSITNVEEMVAENRVNNTASHIMACIASEQRLKIMKKIATMKNTRSTSRAAVHKFSPSNLRNIWKIEADAPFVELNLTLCAESFWQKSGDNDFQNSTALYRHILKQITMPQPKIQEYSIRINNMYAKEKNLRSFPEAIQNFLLDFGEELAGLGYEEIKYPKRGDVLTSTFYRSLGETDDERKAALDILVEERTKLRISLFKSLQKALADVRSCSYEYVGPDKTEFRWIPNKRQAKKRRRSPSDRSDTSEQARQQEYYEEDLS